MTNITTSADDRRRQREEAAHDEVFDRVGIDVDAIDRVAGVRRDVMLQAERLEMFEQTAAQVVDHALAGIDLDLRGVCGHEMVDDLQQHAADDDQDEHARPGCRRRSLAATRATARGTVARSRTLSMMSFSGHG